MVYLLMSSETTIFVTELQTKSTINHEIDPIAFGRHGVHRNSILGTE